MPRTLKQQVRKVIKDHYGDALAKYAEMAGDKKLLDTFVSALAHAISPYGVSSPSLYCTCQLTCFDGHPSPLDIELGKRIRILRIRCLMSIKELAAKIGVHSDYLDELENGKLTPSEDFRYIAARALELPYAKDYLSQDIDETMETEAWVRHAIAMYFGRSLWSFHPEVSYEESINPFVKALVDLEPKDQRVTVDHPIMPTLGNAIRLEEARRSNELHLKIDQDIVMVQ